MSEDRMDAAARFVAFLGILGIITYRRTVTIEALVPQPKPGMVQGWDHRVFGEERLDGSEGHGTSTDDEPLEAP